MIFRRSLLSTLLVFVINFVIAQSSSPFRGQSEVFLNGNEQSAVKEFPIANDGPFLSFCVKSANPVEGLLIRFSEDNVSWADWKTIEDDEHAQEGEIGWISAQGFIDANFRYYQLKTTHPDPVNVSVHFFNPQFTERLTETNQNTIISGRDCTCPIPSFQNRSQWCPSGNCPEHPNPSYTQVTHLIVHHSAGSNTSNDWAAVVRSIWSFHVNDRGWSDIGYNWLVAPSGTIFQGRGDNIIGAHFCGKNSKTMGVCMMGTYMTVLPQDTAVASLQKLLSWKACQEDIDPLATKYHPSSGKYLKQISGHRDGCSTACPGDLFYPTLPEIRQQVSLRVTNNCANIFAPAPLNASIQDNHVQLSWTDNSDNEVGFILERMAANETEFSKLVELPAGSTSYLDETIEADVYYGYRLKSYNTQDTSMYSNELWISTSFGVRTEDQFLNDNTVQLFPNPTTSQFTLKVENELSGKVDIEILSANMEVVNTFSFNKNTFAKSKTLELKNQAPGLYFVKVRQGDAVGVFKIVKVK